MKKIIALALSLIMVLSCTAVFAETAAAEQPAEGKPTLKVLGAFDIQYNEIPDGYSVTVTEQNDMRVTALIQSTQENLPLMVLGIAFNDQWAHIDRFNDATEEEIAHIKGTFEEVDENVTFEDAETALGTKLLIAKEDGGALVTIYSIYKGHEIEMLMIPNGSAEVITDSDIARVIDFLTGIDFVPVQ